MALLKPRLKLPSGYVQNLHSYLDYATPLFRRRLLSNHQAEFQQQWQAAEHQVYVGDLALYSEANLEALGKIFWSRRIPVTIAEAQQLMQSLLQDMFAASSLDN